MLFGSRARGDERPDSDVDIGFVPIDADMTLGDELALQARLERVAARLIAEVALEHADPAPLVEAGAERFQRAVARR